MEHSVDWHSDIGISRRRNEDSIIHVELSILTEEGRETDVTVMLLCDGMGGLNAGDWASQKACSIILDVIEKRNYSTIPELIKRLELSIYVINQVLVEKSQEQQAQIGTTFTLFVTHDGIGHLRHLGDSRLYEITPNASEGNKVKVLSFDQSVVMRNVRNGTMTYEEALNSKNSSVLYMCLGVFPSDRLEIFRADFELEADSSYLIASDGFWHMTTEDEYLDMSNGTLKIADMVERIKLRDEQDNISAIIWRPEFRYRQGMQGVEYNNQQMNQQPPRFN